MSLFVVRLYNHIENYWIDVTGPLKWSRAYSIWNEKTNNGTIRIRNEDGDYYDMFPSDTITY